MFWTCRGLVGYAYGVGWSPGLDCGCIVQQRPANSQPLPPLLVNGLQIHVVVRIFFLSLLEPVDKRLRGPSHLASSLLLAALLVPREKDFLLEQVDIIECLEQVGRLAEQRLSQG